MMGELRACSRFSCMSETQFAGHELSRSIIGAFYAVYNKLGFGFLEVIYASALEGELVERGHRVVREFNVRVLYDGRELGHHRLDMVVDDTVVLEIKSTPVLAPHARRQLHNYLRATNLEVGLLLHFGLDPKVYRTFVPHRGSSCGRMHGSAVSAVDPPPR